MHEGAYQQKQGTLGLVEVGYHHLHDVEQITRGNDYLRTAVQDIQVVSA